MSNLDPVVQIGDWYYQVIYGQLWPAKDHMDTEHMVRLEPRLHSLLNFFLLHPNILLAKDTLIEKVWPTDEGTDAAVMRAVGALRKILGDDVRTPLYIATVSKKGYCWLVQPKAVKLPETVADLNAATTAEFMTTETEVSEENWSWGFIMAASAAILICCASLAYILASFTASPLIKLPDTLSPISALSGQEYWPVLNTDQSKVVYQHKMPGSTSFNWSIQQLSDLRVEHLPERYLALSQAHWLNDQQIIFRANTPDNGCHFYQQTILPSSSPAISLRPCQAVIKQGLQPWQDKWFWLDKDEVGQSVIWTGALDGNADVFVKLPSNWRAVENMLIQGEQLLLLVQETQNNSALFRVDLTDNTPHLVMRFHYLVDQMSWWDDNQLLLAPLSQELQLVDIENGHLQSLGPLTRELTQAIRYPGQVLATQYLDYTTDIYQFTNQLDSALPQLSPWHVSNRSERLLAMAKGQIAFVSERAGHSQIWLAQGKDSVQLSRLNEQQTVQQLLWHNDALLVLVNGKLFKLSPTSAEMKPYPLQVDIPGRYASCNNALYWTALTASGWQLYQQQGDTAKLLQQNVVDVRCGPGSSLLLQLVDHANLALLDEDLMSITQLPVELEWRNIEPEQWFTDHTGVYWLTDRDQVRFYSWHTKTIDNITLPVDEKPLAIYGDGEGLGFIVRPRPHDTDIVWLQNRR